MQLRNLFHLSGGKNCPEYGTDGEEPQLQRPLLHTSTESGADADLASKG